MSSITEQEMLKLDLQGSFLDFVRTFYYIRNNRHFELSEPVGRESHYITIARELTDVFYLKANRLLINVPPGHGKSTLLCYFVAWTFTHYSDCRFLYLAHSNSLAEKNTAEIKAIMSLPQYRRMFGVTIDSKSKAKGNFTVIGKSGEGKVKAFSSSGGVVGEDAGLPNCNRFSGGVIYDDAHKPDDVHSDVKREGVITNYNETVKPRPRGENVPIIFLGQRLHEDDLPAFLIAGKDGLQWRKVILKAIDGAGNALAPNLMSLARLKIEQEHNRYTFASQMQQDPCPSGGALFQRDWFIQLDKEPKILTSFIVADTAETEKTYNDATVFSFFGVYELPYGNAEDPDSLYGLHWIDCVELRIEPCNLESEFFAFWQSCQRYRVQPSAAAIEKKSTGTTLVSNLKKIPGLRIIEIERNAGSVDKSTRFIRIQPYISQHRVTFSEDAKHYTTCVDHMAKITANNTHRFDDIADTLVNGIKIGLLERTVANAAQNHAAYAQVATDFMAAHNRQQKLRTQLHGSRRL